jgi:hypothetical protein
VRARGFAQRGLRRTPAGLGLESEPGSGREKAPTGGTHPSAREKGKERRKQAAR